MGPLTQLRVSGPVFNEIHVYQSAFIITQTPNMIIHIPTPIQRPVVNAIQTGSIMILLLLCLAQYNMASHQEVLSTYHGGVDKQQSHMIAQS